MKDEFIQHATCREFLLESVIGIVLGGGKIHRIGRFNDDQLIITYGENKKPKRKKLRWRLPFFFEGEAE